MAETSYTTQTLLSFAQWLDNRLLDRGQQYINVNTRLYYQPDPSVSGQSCYAAPFRSFVWDSGVNGANPVSVGLSTGPYTGAMSIDYANGRVMFPSSLVSDSVIVSGSYAVKGFNLYFSNQSQERIVFSNKYYLNSRFNRSITGIPPPRSFVTPCIFITSPGEENEPASLGGLYNTKTQVSLVVMGETLAQTQSALDLIRDANQVSFPQLPVSSSPIGPLGDLKQGYNYSLLASQYNQPGNLCTISNVRTSLLSDSVRIDQSIFLGIAEMTVEKMRTIH